MSTVADRLDPATRARLLDRLAELKEVDRVMRRPGRQRPPEPPPTLAGIATQRGDGAMTIAQLARAGGITMTRIPIAFVAVSPSDEPGACTYVAVRAGDLQQMLADPGGEMAPRECFLELPPHVADAMAAQLAAPIQRATVVIGTAVDGAWVSGPLAGSPAPR